MTTIARTFTVLTVAFLVTATTAAIAAADPWSEMCHLTYNMC